MYFRVVLALTVILGLMQTSSFGQQRLPDDQTDLVPLVIEHSEAVRPAKFLMRIDAFFGSNGMKVDKVYEDSPLKRMKRKSAPNSSFEIEAKDQITAVKDGLGRFVVPRSPQSLSAIVNSLLQPSTQILVKDKRGKGSWVYDVKLVPNDSVINSENSGSDSRTSDSDSQNSVSIPVNPDVKSRLVVLLIGDTDDQTVGHFIVTELESVGGIFDEPSQSKYLRQPIAAVHGKDFRQSRILQAINQLSVAPNDTLFCFINCHGAYDPELNDYSNGHFFNMPDNSGDLRRSELRAALERKNAKFTCLISDSCNSLGKLTQVVSGAESDLKANPLFDSLFFGPTGFVDLNSSDQGEFSFAGVFAPVLIKTLSAGTASPGRSNWASYASSLRNQTQARYTSLRNVTLSGTEVNADVRRVLENQTRQTLKAYSLPNP